MDLLVSLPQRLHHHWKLSAIFAAMMLSGCASFQGIAPSTAIKDHISVSTPDGIQDKQGAWPQENWWTAYKDPQLDKLIAHALDNSPSLVAAQTRITRAQALLASNQATIYPQITGAIEPTYGRQSENALIPKPPLGPGGQWIGQGLAAINFSYDLDFWSKNSSLINSAQAQLKAARFDRDAARLALTTSIARTYAQLASQYKMQDVLLATQKQRRDIRSLTSQRVANGLDTQVELKQNETNEAALRVDLAQLDTLIKVTRLQLAALVGEMPDFAQNFARPALSSAPFPVPQNLPLDLLARRPELAAQRNRINAVIGEAEAAKAQFYPNISLTGLVGFQSIGLGQLLAPGSLMTSVGPAIHLPLFDSGRLRANYALKNADIDEAITEYNRSVLNAAQDVAEQLTRASSLTQEENAAKEARTAAEEAYRIAMLRYRAGLSTYLTVLTVESQLLAQRRMTIDVNTKRHDLQISLVRALGGGFNEAPLPQANAQTAN